MGLELVVIPRVLQPAFAQHFLEQQHRAHLADESVKQADLRLVLVELRLPQFLVQPLEQGGQIPVAQRIAERKRAGGFIAGTDRRHVRQFNFFPVAGEQADFFNFTFQLPRVRADAADDFGQRFLGNFLFAFADRRSRRNFRAFNPVLVVRRPRRENLHRAELVERFEKSFAPVHLARADEQPDVLPREFFQFVRQFRQRLRHRRRRGRAFLAEKIAVAQPDNFAGAEEGKGLQ